MEDTLISVILPIYNVEDYLERCIDSVRRQTYVNLEIILVDDGSTDQSSTICDRFERLDRRIKVIHKKNGGLSDARNTGIMASNGTYIALIDSDDIIALNFIEELYKQCVSTNSMIAMCTYCKFIKDNEIIKDNNLNKVVLSGRDFIKMVYEGQAENYSFVAWNKLYDRRLFESIMYPVGRIYEDTFTTYKLLINANQVVLLNCTLYYYRIRFESIMSSQFSLKKIKDKMDANASVVNFFYESQDLELLKCASSYFCKQAVITYYRFVPKVNRNERRVARQYIKKVYKQLWKQCFVCDMDWLKKVVYGLIRILWTA